MTLYLLECVLDCFRYWEKGQTEEENEESLPCL